MLAKICEGIPDALRQLEGVAVLAEYKYDGQRAQVSGECLKHPCCIPSILLQRCCYLDSSGSQTSLLGALDLTALLLLPRQLHLSDIPVGCPRSCCNAAATSTAPSLSREIV